MSRCNRLLAYFLLIHVFTMKKLLLIILFLFWFSSVVWAGLELEKIEFFDLICAML